MECEGFEDVEDKKRCGIECEGNWGSKECNCKARRLGKGGGGGGEGLFATLSK